MKKLILFISMACLSVATSYGVLECQKCKEAHKKDGTKSPFSCHKFETMAKHLLLNRGMCLCRNCKRYFKNLDSYRAHVLIVHGKHACRYCIWHHFKTRDDYERHKDIRHIDYKWRCDTCPGNFPTLEKFMSIQPFGTKYTSVCIVRKKGRYRIPRSISGKRTNTRSIYMRHTENLSVHNATCEVSVPRKPSTNIATNITTMREVFRNCVNYADIRTNSVTKPKERFMNCDMRFCCFFERNNLRIRMLHPVLKSTLR